MSWYFKVLKKYAVFKGRACRREYWMFMLVNFVIYLVIGIIEGVVDSIVEIDISIISLLYSFAILIPSIAVLVRRLHDTNHSGWWYFIIFVPFGIIALLVLTIQIGQSGRNRYGLSPKRN